MQYLNPIWGFKQCIVFAYYTKSDSYKCILMISIGWILLKYQFGSAIFSLNLLV